MDKMDRLTEIEKIADRLGIGKDRNVKCLGCKKTFRFKEAIILTDGKTQKHLCPDCYDKLLKGMLNDNKDELIEKLREIQRDIKDNDIKKAPFVPSPYDPPIRWEPGTYEPPFTIGDKTDGYKVQYNITKDIANLRSNVFMALVPKDDGTKGAI